MKKPVPKQASRGEKKGADKKKQENKNNPNQQEGWFSGLFNKLSLKPKNQMILPDDKNPTILWDNKERRWVNTAGDGEDDLAPSGPPPKDSELMGMGQQPLPNGPAPPMNMNMAHTPPTMPPNQVSYQAAVPALHSLPHSNAAQKGMANVPQNQPLPNQAMHSSSDPMVPGMPPMSNNAMNKYKLQKGRSML